MNLFNEIWALFINYKIEVCLRKHIVSGQVILVLHNIRVLLSFIIQKRILNLSKKFIVIFKLIRFKRLFLVEIIQNSLQECTIFQLKRFKIAILKLLWPIKTPFLIDLCQILSIYDISYDLILRVLSIEKLPEISTSLHEFKFLVRRFFNSELLIVDLLVP